MKQHIIQKITKPILLKDNAQLEVCYTLNNNNINI